MTPIYGQFYYKGDFFSRHELYAEISCRLEMTVFDSSGDIGFEELITQHHLLPLTQYIPKAAHFVHSQLQPQTWLNNATIRSAFCYLGVEKVSIWVPEDAELPGETWRGYGPCRMSQSGLLRCRLLCGERGSSALNMPRTLLVSKFSTTRRYVRASVSVYEDVNISRHIHGQRNDSSEII